MVKNVTYNIGRMALATHETQPQVVTPTYFAYDCLTSTVVHKFRDLKLTVRSVFVR